MTQPVDAEESYRRTWFGWLTLVVDAILCNLIAIGLLGPIVAVVELYKWCKRWWLRHRPPEVVPR